MRKLSNFDLLFKSINNLTINDPTRGNLIYLHDECKGYAIKTTLGGWEVVDFQFINDRINKSSIKCSLL